MRVGRYIHDFFWDMRLNINTRGTVKQKDLISYNQDHVQCVSTAYYVLIKIFKKISIKKTDIFADYGCGKGRVLCFAARFPFKKIIGIEVYPEIASIAVKNSQRVRNRNSRIEIYENDVLDFDCKNVTVFFFFNPFGAKTMKSVLMRIHTSLLNNPRHIQIIYFNPTQAALFGACNWLDKRDDLCYKRRAKDVVQFYENKSIIFPPEAMLNPKLSIINDKIQLSDFVGEMEPSYHLVL